MLWSRSASLISTTRTSSAIASNSLRRLSAWAMLTGTGATGFLELTDPLHLGHTIDQTGDHADQILPRSSCGVTFVSSTTSCRIAAARVS